MAGTVKVDVQINRMVSNKVLSGSLPVNEDIWYKMYDVAGTLVFSKSIIIINAEGRIAENLDVSHLPAGTYQLTVSTIEKILQKISVTI